MSKMLDFKRELMVRKYAQKSIDTYSGCLQMAFNKIGEYPNLTQIKDFLITIKNFSYHKQMLNAIRKYFEFVLKLPIDLKDIPYPRREYKLPDVLSIEEVQKIISIPKNEKHQAIICLLYGCGLRVSELINLKISDIDSARMVITIRASKGNKDRQIMLDEKLLQVLRKHYEIERNPVYLFGGQFTNQYTSTSVNQLLKYWAKKSSVNKRIYAHIFRHSFATHLLEAGTDMAIIQKLLGHNDIKTTEIYAKVSTKIISRVNSPLNNIKI
jgi:integrase/recombinase XerD